MCHINMKDRESTAAQPYKSNTKLEAVSQVMNDLRMTTVGSPNIMGDRAVVPLSDRLNLKYFNTYRCNVQNDTQSHCHTLSPQNTINAIKSCPFINLSVYPCNTFTLKFYMFVAAHELSY